MRSPGSSCLRLAVGLGLLLGGAPARAAVPSKLADPTTRGRVLYATLCVACHGPAGQGDGPLAPSLAPAGLALTLRGDPPWRELETVVQQGRGAMPAFAGRLSPTEQRLVLGWLEKVQAGEVPPLSTPGQPNPAEAGAGGSEEE